MSLQDDIWDLEERLKGDPVAQELLDSIVQRLSSLESWQMKYAPLISALENFVREQAV